MKSTIFFLCKDAYPKAIPLSNLQINGLSIDYSDNNTDIFISSKGIKDKFYISSYNGSIYLSDCLRTLNKKCGYSTCEKSTVFYKKYGFILAPYSPFENIYVITTQKTIKLSNNKIEFFNRFRDVSIGKKSDLNTALNTFFDELDVRSYDILVSGGIDSSALLGFLKSRGQVNNAYMCKMSSLRSEDNIAKSICDDISVPFRLVDLDLDLTPMANKIIHETGEYIYDPITIPLSQLFKIISEESPTCRVKEISTIVDGQGADSLLNGLPANKIYDVWKKLSPIRPLLSVLSGIPVYSSRKTNFRRKIYRISKAIKCLSQENFVDSLMFILQEEEKTSEYDVILKSRLEEIYGYYRDWHVTIRYFYLFEILPVRELQKYAFSNEFNVKIITPFLDDKVIDQLLFIDNDETIKGGVYKYPITRLAKKYWPNIFNSSKTSPFQVEFTLNDKSVKSLSISTLK